MSRLDSAKKYLIDDKSGDAPSDDYLAYTNGSVDGGDPTERSAKRRKLLIGVAVAVAALVVLIGIICYAVLYGNKSEEDKKQPSLPIWDAPRLNASIGSVRLLHRPARGPARADVQRLHLHQRHQPRLRSGRPSSSTR